MKEKEDQDKTDETYEIILARKRAEIDGLDEQIVRAVTARMGISRDIGILKAGQKTPILDANRERELVERAIQRSVELGLAEDDATEIFTTLYGTLLKSSKDYQQKQMLKANDK